MIVSKKCTCATAEFWAFSMAPPFLLKRATDEQTKFIQTCVCGGNEPITSGKQPFVANDKIWGSKQKLEFWKSCDLLSFPLSKVVRSVMILTNMIIWYKKSVNIWVIYIIIPPSSNYYTMLQNHVRVKNPFKVEDKWILLLPVYKKFWPDFGLQLTFKRLPFVEFWYSIKVFFDTIQISTAI